jgi:hypothetical protein
MRDLLDRLRPSDWIGLSAAALAAVAALFAVRADLFGRSSRAKDIRPQPRIRWVGSGVGIYLGFYNVGGPAVHAVWVGTSGARLYAAYATFDGHSNQYVDFVETDLGPLPESVEPLTASILMLAQDVDGHWWDCLKDQAISKQVKKYVASQLESRQLTAFAVRVLEVGRLT